ncbi:hypothetical protein [Photobacterium damselae]|uniref:Uncharacterized protein n=1 Tax=Photobacterium damselae subsp. damselae TaxID=85581 RepID=A0AAD3WY12_PHODD|nr:hypothetical protein [Photobacterium damselae]KAB1180271.1 hypothetical protein F6450_11665 [Photobacterium damselae subsp. damselae]
MEKEIIILISALLGAIAAYITARVTSSSQQNIARINADKDYRIHTSTIRNERLKIEVALRREKLEQLHLILSKISTENSQTISVIQSSDKLSLSDFRHRYLANCNLIHEAQAISALYYPEIRKYLDQIYNQSTRFWFYQENILRTDITGKDSGLHNFDNIREAAVKISSITSNIMNEIEIQGEILSQTVKCDLDIST